MPGLYRCFLLTGVYGIPADPPDFRGAFPLARPGVVLPPMLGRPLREPDVVCVRAIVAVCVRHYVTNRVVSVRDLSAVSCASTVLC